MATSSVMTWRETPARRAAWLTLPTAASGVLQGVLAHEIENAVLALPESARAVILLDLEGFTETECAEILGCAVGTIKSRLARARGLLRERLQDHAR